MTHFTLPASKEKLPLFHEFLHAIGIDAKNISNIFSRSNKNSAKEVYNTSEPVSWEYFCNELEYE